jgi:hypothetical protein
MRPNEFLRESIYYTNLHGIVCSYIRVAEGTYNVETGSTTNTETVHSVKMYKKHINASQYNYPTLIGKDSALFYLANNNISFVPNIRDRIIYNSEIYQVDSYQEHIALGRVCLYRIVGIRG